MPDNKLTDNEIIKALDEAELFLRNRTMDGMSLKLNEYDIGILRNISQVCAKAYDEINRLQAENEGLKTLNSKLEAENYSFKVKERENPLEMALLIDEQAEQIKTAKAEAYKEFAERFKKKLSQKYTTSLWKVYCEEIDNLLKELVGE